MDAPTTLSLGQVAANLAPAFAAGFAVQQCLQIVDSLASWDQMKPDKKRGIMGIISLLLGFVFSLAGLHVLTGILGNTYTPEYPNLWKAADILVSALVISAGTEGFNSVMKFLSYQKESAKADAAGKKAGAANTPAPATAGALALVK
jgi:hypothetical protein